MRSSPPTSGTFEEFYGREWTAAVRLAALITQRRDVAEDVAQEAFTALYPRWVTPENPAAYLRAAIVNAGRQWHRRKAVERAKLPLLTTPSSQRAEMGLLADALAALPYRQRAVLVLRYYTDLPEAEIAEAIGCRPGTVKSLASRALARLQKELPR